MKKFFTLIVPLILSVILILIKIPDIEAWIKTKNVNADIYVALFLIGSTILNHILTVISPFKKYEKLEKNKLLLLDKMTEEFLGQNLFPGNNIVANVRIPKRVFYSNLEPRTTKTVWSKISYLKQCFSKKHLNTIWVSKGNAVPKKLKMTTSQGVSGIAYSEGKVAIVDITQNINELGFNNKQKKIISGNGFVISYPIFAFDEKYSRLGTKIIGVVTLSCNRTGSERLIKVQRNREILTNKIVGFSEICSLIL